MSENMSEKMPHKTNKKPDHWASSYFKQEDMGRRYKNAEIITGAFARTLIEKAGLLEPEQESLAILDNACGTGVVTNALHTLLSQEMKERMDLVCGDFSEPMLDTLSKRIADNGWERTKARMVDAQVCRPSDRRLYVVMKLAPANDGEGLEHKITQRQVHPCPDKFCRHGPPRPDSSPQRYHTHSW